MASRYNFLLRQAPKLRFMADTDKTPEIYQVPDSNLTTAEQSKQQDELKYWVRRKLDENPTFWKKFCAFTTPTKSETIYFYLLGIIIGVSLALFLFTLGARSNIANLIVDIVQRLFTFFQ